MGCVGVARQRRQTGRRRPTKSEARSVGAIAAMEGDGVQYRPTYDRYGNFIGRQPVSVRQ